MDLPLSVFLAALYCILSTVTCAVLFFQKMKLEENYVAIQGKYLELQDKKTTQPLSIEAQQILHDMTAHGQALVRIVPMNPADVFWRSPR